MTDTNIVRCLSCDGYGWHEDDFTGETEDCTWCGGTGYMYELADGTQQQIPDTDYGKVADQLEALEQQRMRELGYKGEAKPPWEQDIRRGTVGGIHPDDRNKD